MAKIHEAELQRLKKIQDVDDDDMQLDVTKRRRLSAEPHHGRHNPDDERKGKHKAAEETEHDETEAERRKSTKSLLITIGAIAGIFLIFLAIVMFYHPTKTVPTIDEMHAANTAGKLKEADGYIYNGYSFIRFGDLWYSQIQNKNTTYDVTFNYDPKNVENISVDGQLTTGFVKDRHIYVTFDPTGSDLKYVGVANYGLSRSLAWAFGYNMTAACTKNYTKACETAGVVTCGDPEKAVIFFKEADETKIILNESCVTVQGRGPDIVRAKDRLLMRWYAMMD